MFSPYLGFTERDIYGVFKIILTNWSGSPTSASSGLALQQDSTNDTSPLTPSTYANSLGSLIPATIVTSGAPSHETGWLLQPANLTGPSILSLLSTVYDESIASGSTAAVVRSTQGALIATDQYVASSTGAITFGGSVALDAYIGLASGMPRVAQSGDVNRLQFKGSVVQRQTTCALFQIL